MLVLSWLTMFFVRKAKRKYNMKKVIKKVLAGIAILSILIFFGYCFDRMSEGNYTLIITDQGKYTLIFTVLGLVGMSLLGALVVTALTVLGLIGGWILFSNLAYKTGKILRDFLVKVYPSNGNQ